MNIRLKDNKTITNNSEIIVRSLKQPTVSEVKIDDGVVKLNIEKELGVEIVGDTKIKVSVEEDEDDYEIISDEPDVFNDDVMSEIDEDYLN